MSKEQREAMRRAIEEAARAQEQGETIPGAAPPTQAFTPPQSHAPEPLPIDWTTEPTPAAANGAQVLHTAQEFALLFTDMAMFPGRNAADGKTGSERARVVSSLRMHPDTYFQMLCVLTSNWNKFVEANVPPQMRQPRFKLLDAGEMQLYGIKAPTEED